MATTIQERMQYLCERTGLSPEKLSVRAGLARSYVRRIIADPSRVSIMGEAAEKLSFASGVSRSWIVSGVGDPDETDVPKLPPPTEKPIAREHTREWVAIALRAIEIDPKLDWAIMGVGEKAPGPREDLTAYELLALADRFKNGCEYEERKRLDQKARRFRKQYARSPERTTQKQPAPRRQSVPPGKA